MPKLKTKSGVKKRFKLTATGKIKHGVAGKRHRLISHNAKYIRQNRGTDVLADADTARVKLWAPYGLNRGYLDMARIKRGTTTKTRHKRLLVQAKGYYGRRKNTIRIARQAVEKAGQYAYRDRKVKKRSFRALWIQRINAAVRAGGPDLRPVHARPQARRSRPRPQGPGRHRDARGRGLQGDHRPGPRSASGAGLRPLDAEKGRGGRELSAPFCMRRQRPAAMARLRSWAANHSRSRAADRPTCAIVGRDRERLVGQIGRLSRQQLVESEPP